MLRFLLGTILIIAGCQTSNQNPIYPYLNVTNPISIQVSNLKGETFNWENLQQNKATAFIFISPECPLCENYSLTINTLQKQFKNEKIELIGIVPGNYYSVEQIDSFLTTYQLNIQVLLDTQYAFCNFFNAKVTPEVFVVNAKSETIYEGKIDNWIQALGIKRRVITKFYLEEAFQSIVNNTPLSISKTEAIGCLIE